MNKNKGFTLIELLVVIAIIGVLASVVLASLNTARTKGADAAIKSNMANARAQAELYSDGNTGSATDSDANIATTGYSGVCTSTAGIASNLAAVTSAGGTGAVCQGDASAWAMATALKTTGTYWCVDSTGASKGTLATGTTSYTSVTAALTNATDYTCN